MDESPMSATRLCLRTGLLERRWLVSAAIGLILAFPTLAIRNDDPIAFKGAAFATAFTSFCAATLIYMIIGQVRDLTAGPEGVGVSLWNGRTTLIPWSNVVGISV